jgi:hypothetical protein
MAKALRLPEGRSSGLEADRQRRGCRVRAPAERHASLPPPRPLLARQPGDVIYIEANSGAVKRVGR